MMMDPDRLAEDDDSEEEVDWMDTNWHTVQESSSSKTVESMKETETKSRGDHGGDDSAPLMTRMQLNDHKAGMEGLDKEHINQVIYQVSKGSRFFENERRKEEQVQQRIQEQEKKRRTILDSDLQKGMAEADKLIAELKQSRDLTQTIVHVDMDAFYAAVEMRDNPSLRNKPMAVGGIGMLSTSNYEARKYGVRAAMPGFIGKKLCPQLVIVPLNFAKYREVSEQVRQIFADYNPHFCPMSLDEAYLNFTQHVATRHRLSMVDRSFLKRCQTPADAAFCRCDLNSTIRDSVFEKLRAGTAYSAADCSQKPVDINCNSKNKSQCSDSDSLNQTENQTPEPGPSKTSDSLSCAVVEELSPCITVQSVDDLKSQQSSAAEQYASKEGAAKSQCPSCGKTVPPYDIVTFGVDVESAVHEMRCRIEQRTCLTASAGIAPNMMLSKVCSDQNKPNGQFFLPARCEEVMQFVQKLPIRKISGIGRVTEQLLGALGISTCSDLFEKRSLLYHLYSHVSFSYFMRVACGIGSTQVARASEEERKSMSTEQTFGELSQPEELTQKCWELCQLLAEDLGKELLKGKTISLKLKTTDFQVRTRAQTISSYTSDADVIFTVAKGILQNEILAESPKSLRLRLMGVRMSKLIPESECPQEKQNTILGFFKKTPVPGCQENPAGLQKQSSSVLSFENNQQFSISDSDERLGSKTTDTQVLERNTCSASSIQEQVDCDNIISDCTPGVDVLACDDFEASTFPQVCMDEKDKKSSWTELQDTGKLMENSSVENYETGPNVSDDDNHGDSSDRGEDIAETDCVPKQKGSDSSSEVSQTQNRSHSSTVTQSSKSELSSLMHTLPEISSLSHNTLPEMSSLSHSTMPEMSSLSHSTMPEMSSLSHSTVPEMSSLFHSTMPEMSSLSHTMPEMSCLSHNTVPEMSSLSHSHTKAVHTAATSSEEYERDDEIRNSNSDRIHQDAVIPSSSSVREPFTCPVCCKPVGCINLTDFNAHIDKCLQPQAQQPVHSQHPITKTSKSGSSQTSTSQKAKHSQNNKSKNLSGGKSSAETKKQRHVSGSSSSSAKGITGSVQSGVSSSRTPGIMDESRPSCSNAGLEKQTTPVTAQYQNQQESCTISEPDALDYMVCPLCGAERADWTLDMFNQHVDVCLNRNTISQILREQQTTEERIRKRPASSQQEDHRSSQQGKKAKKGQSPKTERSILSFFKR